jgi:hypothetical protein
MYFDRLIDDEVEVEVDGVGGVVGLKGQCGN